LDIFQQKQIETDNIQKLFNFIACNENVTIMSTIPNSQQLAIGIDIGGTNTVLD